jgi:hypothetical protein
MRDSRLFDRAVKEFFEPIAAKLGLPLGEIREGVYEIASPRFIMRIRLHTGHRRGLNVLLREASAREFDENEPGIEYGIGNFVMADGEEWEERLVETDDDFLRRAEYLVNAAKRFGIPYLLGQKKDFRMVKEMVEQRAVDNVAKIKNAPKSYQSFNAAAGYPTAPNLFYECLGCGDVVPSVPEDSTQCRCRNIMIDVAYGRISIQDHAKLKLFSTTN